MKLLSIAVPSYNSQDYLRNAVESLLPGDNRIEILIVNDGSSDATGQIAEEYQRRYPETVRAIHKENGGHGDAVMTALQNASGLYFKVVDSDDWLDAEAYPEMLKTLGQLALPEKQVDLLICNYIYDKVGKKHKRIIRYNNTLPENRPFTWQEVKHFRIGQYILMHSAIYRTRLLQTCGLELPKHTFYVDNLYVYKPMLAVQKMYYLNVDLYHYYIGREDQSVQEQIMIRRIDQQIQVNKMMSLAVDVSRIEDENKRKYMRNYLEIITAVSTILLVKSGTEEHLQKKSELWKWLEAKTPQNYRLILERPLGRMCQFKGPLGRKTLVILYRISRKLFGFN